MSVHRAEPREVCILAGCFEGLPARAVVARASTGTARVVYVESRARLRGAILANKPEVLVLPAVDAEAVTTVPLVENVLAEFPTLYVAILLTSDSDEHPLLMKAIQAGADVWMTQSLEVLQRELSKVAGYHHVSDEEFSNVDAKVMSLPRIRIARLFGRAVRAAGELEGVGDWCTMVGIPRRTLIRRLQGGGWPSASEVLAWARLTRASMLSEKGIRNMRALARAGGFSTVRALQRDALTLLGTDSLDEMKASPSTVVNALHGRIRSAEATELETDACMTADRTCAQCEGRQQSHEGHYTAPRI